LGGIFGFTIGNETADDGKLLSVFKVIPGIVEEDSVGGVRFVVYNVEVKESVDVGNGKDVFVGNGKDVFVGNGIKVFVGNGKDVFVGNGKDVFVGNGKDVFVGNGKDVFVGNGKDVFVDEGADSKLVKFVEGFI
jgi:hypothetical protein